jgi:hypothetical protein
MVLAADRDHGNRLVVIDGFGDRLFVPIYTHSHRANAWNLNRRFGKLVAAIDAFERKRTNAQAKETQTSAKQ